MVIKMFLSCSLYKPQKPDVYNILTKKGTYPIHDDYKLYIKNVQEQRSFEPTSFGRLIDVYYDDNMVIRKMDEETLDIRFETVRYTEGPKNVYIFYKEPLNNVLGIFASSGDAGKIARVVSQVTKRVTDDFVIAPLKSLQFLLKDKENEITQIEEFGETIEVRVSDIRDPYIADAWLKGSDIDQSVEYEKLIRDPAIGGMVEYMAINYRRKTYFIFSNGRLFTRQASENILEDIYPIYEITERLFNVGAVQF